MIQQKVVLVTGCSLGGLGNALCKAFATAGCTVYGTARASDVMQLQQHGIRELELDVTNPTRVQEVVQQVLQESGRIDVVVNNAGVMRKEWLIEADLSSAREMMEVNFFAVLAINKAVAPHMIKSGSGVIVNIGSSTGYVAIPQAAVYSASKHAVRAYSDALRVELSPFGVKVMHVAPGFMRTQLFSKQGVVKPNSMYKQFSYAVKQLLLNDAQEGIGGLGATEPEHMARRIVQQALKRYPPRHFVDGWLSWPIYLCGCYAPCWLVDLLQKMRLQLLPEPLRLFRG